MTVSTLMVLKDYVMQTEETTSRLRDGGIIRILRTFFLKACITSSLAGVIVY